jgi:hypothetical protein
MSNSVSYVKATTHDECIIACLAMIRKTSFDVIANEVKNRVGDEFWMAYLSAHGYAIQDIHHDYMPENRLISPWPIKPFAPIHIVFVYDQNIRPVIMLDNGTILDPLNIHNESRHKYHRVYRVVGVWQVRESLDFVTLPEPQTTILKAIPTELTI